MGSLQEMRVQQVRDLNSTVFLGIATGFFLLAPKARIRALMTDPVLRATSYFALASSVVSDLLHTQKWPEEGEKRFELNFKKMNVGSIHVLTGFVLDVIIFGLLVFKKIET